MPLEDQDQFRTIVYEFMGSTKSTLRHLTEVLEKLEDCQRQDKENLYQSIDKKFDSAIKDVNNLRNILEKKMDGFTTKIITIETNLGDINSVKSNLEDIKKDLSKAKDFINAVNTDLNIKYTRIVAWAGGAGFVAAGLVWLIKEYVLKI